MRDAVARDLVELPMQRVRIRRRQRAVDGTMGRHQPDGADAGRLVAELLPDLTRESGDRGLAAGSRDGRDGCRLPRVKSRSGQRQRAPRMGRVDEWNSRTRLLRMIAPYRNRDGCYRGIDEARAIGLVACERKE